MGFEYGYSLDCPEGLVLWEAQYGDFVNAAQVIIDQFIASAEDKWRRLSGLVMLLASCLRGQRPRTFQRPAGAVLVFGGRRQFTGRFPIHSGTILSLSATAGETKLAEATHRGHTQEFTTSPA